MPDKPYPENLAETFTLHSGRPVLLRPIRPEDEPEHHALLAKLTPEDIHSRFFGTFHKMPHSVMERFTNIDYDREMAFIASADTADGGYETLGVVRTINIDEGDSAEFAIVIRSDIKHQGLGGKLMEKIISYSRDKGVKRLEGMILAENHPMLDLVRRLGFRVRLIPGEGVMETTLDL
ncbi:MAG: GNAT family N-acetyltransferase [Rhodospirillales bacterium]|nr:GNAT family N-acetyltransferase [Rhodospirillales bacterium]